MLKIFHTADIHIGLKFFGRDYSPELKEELINERYKCLERMVHAANENNCDLFVIAGDLFDSGKLNKKEIKQTAEILNKFEGYIIILPGNHDFYNEDDDKIWITLKDFKKDNLLLLEKTIPYELSVSDHKVRIYPGPCQSKHSKSNMIGWINNIEKDFINIGIAHGAVEGFSPDNEDKYFLMTTEEFQNIGMDLWLLGHSHIQIPNKPGEQPLFFMPSVPEPDGFNCRHEGFAFIIELDKKITYKIIKTGGFRFLTLNKEVNCLDDLQDLETEINSLPENTLLKLNLSGYLNSEEMNSIKNFQSKLKVKYCELNNDIVLNIDKKFIIQNYAEDSLPFMLLLNLTQNDPDTINLAYELLEESKI